MRLLTRAAYATLFLMSPALAHGDDESMDMGMGTQTTSSAAATTAYVSPNSQSEGPTSYFAYGQYSNAILAHIALMALSWCFVLPAAVMLSIGRSRLALSSQFLFLVFNTLDLLFGISYNSHTPDLYRNNAHHKIGWIVTWVVGAQVVLALILKYAGHGDSKESQSRFFECAAFLPVATEEHECPCSTGAMHEHRWSRDNYLGTEPSSSVHSALSPSYDSQAEYYDFENPEQLPPKPSGPRDWFYSLFVDRFLSNCVPGMVPNRVLRIFSGVCNIIDRIILPFGFIAITTGAVTYAGIFHGNEIFNGLAHFIKGGIFFWYGVITLGRYPMGVIAVNLTAI